jgi:hypothetical protein
LTFGVTTPAACPWFASTSASWITVADPQAGSGTGTVTYSVLPNWGAPRTGTIVVGGQTFAITQSAGSANAILNGTFESGLAGWNTFASPDSSYIVTSVVAGVLEFYRQPPPPGTTNQATVFQNSGVAVAQGVGPGTLRSGHRPRRKRVSVLILDADFTDLPSARSGWRRARRCGYRMLTTRASRGRARPSTSTRRRRDRRRRYQIDNVSMYRTRL